MKLEDFKKQMSEMLGDKYIDEKTSIYSFQ